jgi:Undecaprenyl-phosphate glucose phosphotransferase
MLDRVNTPGLVPAAAGQAGADEIARGVAAAGSGLAETLVDLPPAKGISPVVLAGIVRLAEFVTLTLVGALLFLLVVYPVIGASNAYLVAVPAVALATLIILQTLDVYHVGAFRSVVQQGFRLVGGWILVFLVAFATVFFLKLEGVFSRSFFLTWFVVGLLALLSVRVIVSVVVRDLTRRGRLDRRTAIVGGGEIGARLIQTLTAQQGSDLKICGVFDDRTDARSPDLCAGFPKLGNIDDLVAYARRTRLDLVIFAMPVTAEQRLLQMLKKLWVLPIDIRLAAHTQKLRFRPRNYTYIAGTPMFDVADKPIADWDIVTKWLFDKVVGSLILVLVSPIMLATAIAIKLDSRGPVLFRQKRYGFNNELIEVFKFRSMYVDQCDATASKLVTKGDPRVTRVGRFIRKSSIDELPQLFNVIFRGNLSIVGPRPHAVHAKAEQRLYDDVVDGYFARHKVKPGITGWAQINGWRGETDTEEKIQKRVEHDLFYIENWSVLFDFYITFMTPFSLIKSENAY